MSNTTELKLHIANAGLCPERQLEVETDGYETETYAVGEDYAEDFIHDESASCVVAFREGKVCKGRYGSISIECSKCCKTITIKP